MKSSERNIRKAAILLIALGPDISSSILKLLPDNLIQKVTYEIANIDYVEPYERDMVIEEFVEMASARQYILDGGIDYAKNLLTKALGTQRAMEIMDVLNQIQQKERPFAIARKADPHQLYNLLINEHPQTVALILCYIQPDKAAIVLSQFPSELQTEVAERIGMINRTSPSIIKKIEKIMEAKFSNIIDSESETIGGVKSLVDILNSVDRSTERNIIGNLETNQPDLAEIVKSNLFIFEDIVNLDRSSIQRILREVSNEDLALALKGASEKVVNVVFSNMSKRAAEMLKEDIQFMGPVRLSTVEEAQFKIVGIIRRLDEVGEIIIGRGDQDTVIV
ncbi:flagellar motor switch protein FliG [Paratissierella segnis]|jgi:flagellar motor switch protein FliG|uniref:Flagellar motor switch protein FliG n=1 Tax=Paratissierella segnis TaxID=2763679 RepID=A0A926ET11_9FIRM|nr:flagellar motor switch protein FliG [Paratissierella segnis]MBC8588326.1 flagellar motor switch protein FliG [Paratissierella segnis]